MKVTQVIPEYQIVAPNEALISWKNDPITQQIKSVVAAELQLTGERLADGETLSENIVRDTARAVGYADALKFIEDLMNFTIVVEKTDDDEPETEEAS